MGRVDLLNETNQSFFLPKIPISEAQNDRFGTIIAIFGTLIRRSKIRSGCVDGRSVNLSVNTPSSSWNVPNHGGVEGISVFAKEVHVPPTRSSCLLSLTCTAKRSSVRRVRTGIRFLNSEAGAGRTCSNIWGLSLIHI